MTVDWPRLGLTLGLLALCVLLAYLLLVGWRSRARRQGEFPAPPPAPAAPGSELVALDGLYVATTYRGDWQDRIVVHTVGRRARATARLFTTGVLIDRIGETPLWIPRAALLDVGNSSRIAGKVTGLSDGILLIAWNWDGKPVDTGFQAEDPALQAYWIGRATELFTPQSGVTG